MNIAFIHQGGPDMASYRYRAEMPAKHLGAKLNDGLADVVVFSKPVPADLDIARMARNDGCKLVVDFCDDHFQHEVLGPIYVEMANLANRITCPTVGMRERIRNSTGMDAAVIPDPYEMPLLEPHANGENTLWFGHQRNIGEIVPWFKRIDMGKFNAVTGQNNVLTGYTPWSVENMQSALAEANTVILPSKDQCKSANRLINAIRSGCFVVAKDVPAHKEFREFVWVGKMETGLRWFKVFQADLNDRVKAGQAYIEKYSPERIGDQWKTLMATI